MTDANVEVEQEARAEAERRMAQLLEIAGTPADIRAWWVEGFVQGARWGSGRPRE